MRSTKIFFRSPNKSARSLKIVYTAQNMKFSITDFSFTEEILNGKLLFLRSVGSVLINS